MKRTLIVLLVAPLFLPGLPGCQSPTKDAQENSAPAAPGVPTLAPTPQSTTQTAGSPSVTQPLAFVDNHPLALADMGPALVEDAGGEVLAEQVLDVKLAKLLSERGKKLTSDEVDGERKLLLGTLSPKADEAQTLLQELRDRRGLGSHRFQRLLTRNAAMRILVQPEVVISDAALQLAYKQVYGPRYQARIITVETLAEASEVVHKARAGEMAVRTELGLNNSGSQEGAAESFSDLAIQLSTDASKNQGGLLSPINADDPAYPDAIRMVLAKMEVHAISDPIILEHGYAILKLEEKIAARNVKFDDVKTVLQSRVRRQVERMLMDRLARTLVQEADVVITDSALQQSWAREKKLLLQTP